MRASWLKAPAGQGLALQNHIRRNPPMIPRIYIDTPIHPGKRLALTRDMAHYLRTVLRRNAGDAVIVFNGRGGENHAEIMSLGKTEASLLIHRHDNVSRELTPAIHVIQAACRNEKIEHVLQKCVELGAASLQIVRSERASLKLDERKLHSRLQRWQKIIVEAAEQSGRTIIPPLSWQPGLNRIDATGLKLTLHPAASRSWSRMCGHILESVDITIAIGPEGGWSPADLQTLDQTGFTGLRFGPRILRTETAAPALLAAIQAVIPEKDC